MADSDILLPTLIDKLAAEEPDKLFCAYAESAAEADVLRQITYRAFANAVNACAWWLQDTLGEGLKFETIAYLGPSDIQPAIFTLAAAKVNRKAFLVSPRNSIVAQLRLLQATECKVLVIAQDFLLSKSFTTTLARNDIHVLQIKLQKHWLDHEGVPSFAFNASFKECPERPFVVLHTSGSTGYPKPIIYTFAGLNSYVAHANPKDVDPDCAPTQTDIFKDTCQYVAFPTFHMVGLICLTAVGVYWSSPAILGPSTSLPTVDVATKIHKHPLCKGTMLPPSLLVDIANSDDARSALSGLKYVNWLGGQLPSHVMKLLKAHVNIYSSFGATEFGNIPLNIESQDNAGYYSFSKLAGATFRRYQGTNGEAAAKDPDTEPLFELVLERQPSIVSAQLIFLNNPKLQQYATKDLFSTQPDKPHLWRYRGRTDDMINTAHGQLIDPTLQENTVGANPAVSCALLVGTNRKAPAWLIELRVQADGDSEKAALKERIWESVQRANELAPDYARVKKGKILFTKPDKPMLRASKGTVKRNATIEAYKEEIDQLYKSRPSSVSW